MISKSKRDKLLNKMSTNHIFNVGAFKMNYLRDPCPDICSIQSDVIAGLEWVWGRGGGLGSRDGNIAITIFDRERIITRVRVSGRMRW